MGSLIISWRLIKKWDLRQAVILSFLIALLVMVDSLSLLTFLLWLMVFVLSLVIKPKLRKVSIVVVVSRLTVICMSGVLLTSFWFTPGLIGTFLSSPSLGGRPFFSVALGTLNRLVIFIPVIFGLIAARKLLNKSSVLTIVGVMGFILFGGLTISAFVADPDFWQDYSRFGRSMDLSLGLVFGGILVEKINLRKRVIVKRIFLIVLVLIFSLPFVYKRGKLFGGRFEIERTSEYRVGEVLEDLVNDVCDKGLACGVRAYLSGSSVYWLNSWFDVEQVRGGGNQGSLNDYWPHGSYQIREGSREELSGNWLEALGVSYLVVHNFSSSEVYHDFRFPGKFQKIDGWNRIWEEKGDVVYFNSRSTIARVTDLKLLKSEAPEKGDDLEALRNYVEELKQPVTFRWTGLGELEFSGDVNPG